MFVVCYSVFHFSTIPGVSGLFAFLFFTVELPFLLKFFFKFSFHISLLPLSWKLYGIRRKGNTVSTGIVKWNCAELNKKNVYWGSKE